MELRHLKYFVAVAEELNFTRAADRLHTAQPSLSQQIRDLEDDVGTPLLYRTKRRVDLTRAGELFLTECRTILEHVDRATMMARQTARTESGDLVIGFTPSAEVKVFPHILPLLRQRFPEVHVVLHSMTNPDLQYALVDKEIDVAFLRRTELGEDFQLQPVLRDPLIAMLPENHVLAQQSIVQIEQFGQYPFIGVSKENAPELRGAIQRCLDTQGVALQTVQEGGNVLTVLNLVAIGVGICILPDYVRSFAVKGVTSRPIEGDPFIELCIAWRKGNHSSVLASFLRLLETTMVAIPGHVIGDRLEV